jgi:hypothetical protein
VTPQELLSKNGIELESYKPDRYYTTCPKCSHTRSAPHRKNKVLGVTIGDDGSVCWGCNHCGWIGPEKGSGAEKGPRPALPSYVYRDADGVVRFRKVRNLPGREPRFWLERPDGSGGWIKGTKGVDTKILYHADEVAKAIAAGRVICCVEGEKDADSLWALGIAATCNAHGASDAGKRAKWTAVHSAQLAGADLVVLNDNDAAGYAHADATCRLSLLVAKRLRRLDLKPHWPEIPKGGDVSDWLALSHTRAELAALIEQAPDFAPAAQGAGARAPAAPIDDAAEIERLARMGPLDYERNRKVGSERLAIRASMLDAVVKAKRVELGLNGGDDKQGEAIEFPAPEPWPQPVDGAELLDEIAKAVRAHVIMADHARDACALWAVHSYVFRHFAISPKLYIHSAVKRCGKSTLLEVLSHLAARPMLAANITPATAFRIIAKHQPTLLIDEVDSFLAANEELRGILNASHRHDGRVPRLVGEDYEPRNFRVYTPVALSGIGSLHSTLLDRAIIINLVRRRGNEKIASLRIGKTGHLDNLARRIVRWVADHEEQLAAMEPAMPDGIINREADNWIPLLAIADAAGGKWPERGRKAAGAAHIAAGDDDWLELVLGDIRTIFIDRFVTRIGSAAVIEDLIEIQPRPWAEYSKSGKPITQNKLARLLKPLGITPGHGKVILDDGSETNARHYELWQFKEAFERFLPPLAGLQLATWQQLDEISTSEHFKVATPNLPLPVGESKKSNNDGLVAALPLAKGGSGKKAHAPTARSKSDDFPYAGPVVEVPDLGPDNLDKHGTSNPCAPRNPERASDPAELCAYCKRPGGEVWSYGDSEVRLHPECENPWIEARMAEEGIWRA